MNMLYWKDIKKIERKIWKIKIELEKLIVIQMDFVFCKCRHVESLKNFSLTGSKYYERNTLF